MFQKPVRKDQINIDHSLCKIKFGMQSKSLAFVDECHKQNGNKSALCCHAWLAGLPEVHIIDNTKSNCTKTK